jgi:hypothetical protein
MSNAARYPGASEAAKTQSTPLEVVEGGDKTSELNETVFQYPDYNFGLTSEQIVEREATGIFGPVAVEHSQRLGAVLNSLAETCGGEYSDLSTPGVREKRLNIAYKYLAQNITVTGGTCKRRDVIDKKAAIEEVLDSIAPENHPVSQILKFIHSKYRTRLNPQQLDKLTFEIVTITQWKKLHDVYARHTEARRKPS